VHLAFVAQCGASTVRGRSVDSEASTGRCGRLANMTVAAAHYQVMLLGSQDERRGLLLDGVAARLAELGLPGGAIRFLSVSEAPARNRRLPAIAVFLGAPGQTNDTALVRELIEDSLVVVPVVSSVIYVQDEIPPQLRHINALEMTRAGVGVERLVSLIFEAFRLLRRERKLFISYRRDDAQPLAERLYDELDRRGFDVFIDVRSVPPAVDFQSELWHRMSDSDVVILIDTPGFRESRWTTAELAQANLTNIQILHLLWPGQSEDSTSAFSRFLQLQRSDFVLGFPRRGRWVRSETVGRICAEVERLRARAIAARHRYLIDNFCDACRDSGLSVRVQPEQWMSVYLSKRPPLAVVPAVGVPTSERLNAIADAIMPGLSTPGECWVIYDNRGILDRWLNHLDWLDQHLPIRTVRMSNVANVLRTLDS